MLIKNYTKSGTPQNGENLSLMTDIGNIQVRIGKYEKRPTFMVADLNSVSQYSAENARKLIDSVALAYADIMVLPYKVY